MSSGFWTTSTDAIIDVCRCLKQGLQTRGPRGHFVRPAMLFGNFQIINVYVIEFIRRCLRELG